MDGRVANVCQSHLHDFSNPVEVDVVHAEGFDVVLADDGLFGGVDVAESDVDELAEVDAVGILQPAKDIGVLGGGGGEA